MNDVEKTIKALECMTGAMVGITCDGCPLYGDVEMRKGKNVWTCKMCTAKDAEVLKSALVLLKACGPKSAKIESKDTKELKPARVEGDGMIHVAYCPTCGKLLQPWGANYCYECGQAVKWP